MKRLIITFIFVSGVVCSTFQFSLSRSVRSFPATTRMSIGQNEPPLTLEQVDSLIKNKTPDQAIATEINNRGISFAAAQDVVKKLGAGERTTQAIKDAYDHVPYRSITLIRIISIPGREYVAAESVSKTLEEKRCDVEVNKPDNQKAVRDLKESQIRYFDKVDETDASHLATLIKNENKIDLKVEFIVGYPDSKGTLEIWLK
jgi:hypothetical protein